MPVTIKLLGNELGNVIKEQAGIKYYKIVEKIRLNSKKYRSTKDEKYLKNIFTLLNKLNPDEIFIITKSFTIFFYLSNIAEQVFREHFLENKKVKIRKTQKTELSFTPVFTAHPTESSRQSTLKKIYKIGELIEKNSSNDMSEINTLISQLWYTRDIRSTKPDPLDEVKSLIYYLEILYTDVYENIVNDDEIKTSTNKFNINFGSWVGADKDGNPFITTRVTKDALKIYSNQIINIYKRKIIELSEEFSISTDFVKCPKSLEISIKNYSKLLPNEYRHYSSINFDEPFRIFLSLVFHRLDNFQKNKKGYQYFDEFHKDVLIFRDSVNSVFGNKMQINKLNKFINYIEQFEFHGVSLDIRQNSSVINSKKGKLHSDFSNLLAEIPKLQQIYGNNVFKSLILSMTKSHLDIINLFNLCKENMPIKNIPSLTPLIEEIDDLDLSASIIDDLFKTSSYIKFLKEHKNGTQEIMLGYSDSNKDGGIVASQWSVYKAQIAIYEVGINNNIVINYFHGRGGTISRGGGPTYNSIMSQPKGTISNEIRYTEQGEVISDKYSTPYLAFENLKLGVAAFINRSSSSKAMKLKHQKLLNELAEVSFNSYRQFIQQDGLINFFENGTPVNLLSILNIGSRPSKRSQSSSSLENYRAIPWVFGWAQTRNTLTGWYGSGTALDYMINKYGIEEIRRIYKNSEFLQNVISNVEMTVFKSDLKISKLYVNALLNKQSLKIHKNIAKEAKLVKSSIKNIKQTNDLLSDNTVLKNTLNVRNAYLDPLSLIQITLMKKMQNTKLSEKEERALLLSINGLAAGLRNTG